MMIAQSNRIIEAAFKVTSVFDLTEFLYVEIVAKVIVVHVGPSGFMICCGAHEQLP